MTQLTQSRLHELFDYSVVTGLLYSKTPRNRWGRTPAGTPLICARFYHPDGRPKYAQFDVDGEKWYHHRLIWFWVTGELPETVDHENRDICHNAWHNLRDATVSQNGWNRNKQANNTSGYKGVHFVKSKGLYRATIRANNVIYRLGNYITAEDAYAAYKAKAKELHGDFVRHDEN